jgi:hypothetical protein
MEDNGMSHTVLRFRETVCGVETVDSVLTMQRILVMNNPMKISDKASFIFRFYENKKPLVQKTPKILNFENSLSVNVLAKEGPF